MMPAFDEIWFVDFEFRGEAGDPPEPVCMVANEWFTGREIRLWEDELRRRSSPPYRCDRRVLFVSYVATAELVCHLALGWELPAVVLDLFVEFRRETNGKHLPAGRGLLGALTYYEISGIDPSEKKEMINLILRGGWSSEERRAILDYCHSDVGGLRALFPAMLPTIDWPRALLRGRYMRALTDIEWAGIPLDAHKLAQLKQGWVHIQKALIAEIDKDYNVYEGTSFRQERFAHWLYTHDMLWPLTEKGRLSLARLWPFGNGALVDRARAGRCCAEIR